MIQEIAAANNELSVNADQVGLAVSQLDKVIQANAASAQEMSSTSEELSGQAVHLTETIGYFRMSHKGPAVKTVKVAPRPRPALLEPPSGRFGADVGVELGLADEDDLERF